jgi:site-specific recombinase XerD
MNQKNAYFQAKEVFSGRWEKTIPEQRLQSQPFEKEESARCKVYFNFTEENMKRIRSIVGAFWSKDYNAWLIPRNEEVQKKVRELIPNAIFKFFPTSTPKHSSINMVAKVQRTGINWQSVLEKVMRTSNYSHKSIKAYTQQIALFMAHIGKDLEDCKTEDLKEYVHHLLNERKLAEQTVRQAFHSVKYYFRAVLSNHAIGSMSLAIRGSRKLPVILSRSEIRKILEITTNLKHKLLLSLAYSGGVRVGELISLKIEDIDRDRNTLRIRQGKGRKDRYTLLSQHSLELLGKYLTIYHPVYWLFEGHNPEHKYSIRSAQEVFNRACLLARIDKRVSIHSLRHAFATHLLEQGVSLRVIQELLGHASSKTTEIYTHVSTNNYARIVHPLDHEPGLTQEYEPNF